MSEATMHVELTKEHEWLAQMVGEWSCEMEAAMGPDQPSETHRSTERVTSLGGAWVICEGDMGGDHQSRMTLGYDPAKGRFVGSFVGSMMTSQWVYDGELEGNTLVLYTEGPSFSGDGNAPYVDRMEIRGPDHRVLTSTFRGTDGEWHHFMTAHYRRV